MPGMICTGLGVHLFVFLLAPTAFSGPDISYGGAVFRSFVAESYRDAGRRDPAEFFRTMDARAKAAGLPTWKAWVAANRATGAPGQAKAAGEAVWKRIKKTITKFSLDRGFEFVNVTTTGERQCYLQSVIVAGTLRKAGYDAGVFMVWANPKGETSNNGHAVAVVRDRKADYVVDCSEPYPLEVHAGLFAGTRSGYRFLRPRYVADRGIAEYRDAGGRALPRLAIRFLDRPFLDSQFDYYRGERATGGILSRPTTSAGIAKSERYFRKALAECPENPLPRAMLVQLLRPQSVPTDAAAQIARARALYTSMGWMPDSLRAKR